VFGHKLNVFWKDAGPLIRDLPNTQRVAWTLSDVAHFISDGDGDEKIRGPVVLWFGSRPDSLQSEDAFSSSNEILNLRHRRRPNGVSSFTNGRSVQRFFAPSTISTSPWTFAVP
jgi:hypothetical protein